MTTLRLLLSLAALAVVMACLEPENLRALDGAAKAKKLAGSLSREYKSNPIRFERDFTGKRVKAYGQLERISTGGVVTFDDGPFPLDNYRWLVCKFPNRFDVADLSLREWIAVSGTVDSVGFNEYGDVTKIYLTDCVLLAVGRR